MDRKNPADLLWMFRCNFDPGSVVKQHAHMHHYLIMYIVQGEADFMLEGTEFAMQQGDIALITPNTRHGMAMTHGPVTNLEIKFTANDTDLRRMLHMLPPLLRADDFTLHLIKAASEASGFPSQSSWQASNCYLVSLLYHLCAPSLRKEAALYPGTSTLPKTAETDAFSPVTHSIIRYVQDHYADEISLEDIAQAIRYNKNYMCNVFKKDAGRTINEYLTDVRIAHAEEMLTFSHYTLNQVAANTGFNSISHFNRTFKKKVGVPPGLYKRIFPEDEMLSDLGYGELSPQMRQSLMHFKWLQMRHSGYHTIVEEE